MRRLLVLVALVALVGATPPATATSTPRPGEGVNVVPDPASARKSPAGTVARLGEVRPGAVIRDAVVIRSSFAEAKDVVLYAADGVPATGGGFGFRGQRELQDQVGAWLRLSRDRVSVPAGGEVRVPYELSVPTPTDGGEYVGGIIAEVAHQQPTGGGLQTRIRFAMAVYLSVPGGVAGATPGRGDPDGELVLERVDIELDGSKACPVVRYRNDSQEIVNPTATVTVDGLVGDTSSAHARIGALLPEASAEVELPCVDRSLGPSRIEITLESPRGGGSHTTRSTWLPGPLLVSLLLLLILVAALLTTFIRGMRRKQSQSDARSTERASE